MIILRGSCTGGVGVQSNTGGGEVTAIVRGSWMGKEGGGGGGGAE